MFIKKNPLPFFAEPAIGIQQDLIDYLVYNASGAFKRLKSLDSVSEEEQVKILGQYLTVAINFTRKFLCWMYLDFRDESKTAVVERYCEGVGKIDPFIWPLSLAVGVFYTYFEESSYIKRRL